MLNLKENSEDIFDGTEYQKHDILKDYGNFSFMFNTDGVAVFKSGTQQLWQLKRKKLKKAKNHKMSKKKN